MLYSTTNFCYQSDALLGLLASAGHHLWAGFHPCWCHFTSRAHLLSLPSDFLAPGFLLSHFLPVSFSFFGLTWSPLNIFISYLSLFSVPIAFTDRNQVLCPVLQLHGVQHTFSSPSMEETQVTSHCSGVRGPHGAGAEDARNTQGASHPAVPITGLWVALLSWLSCWDEETMSLNIKWIIFTINLLSINLITLIISTGLINSWHGVAVRMKWASAYYMHSTVPGMGKGWVSRFCDALHKNSHTMEVQGKEELDWHRVSTLPGTFPLPYWRGHPSNSAHEASSPPLG